jgi:LPXTG-site transpeptidase (sortase) family protein
MARRFLLLASLCVLMGMATHAFGADVKQAPWITREGAVAMLVESKPEWRADLAAARATPSPLPIYVDTDADEWYVPYLEVAFAKGLIQATDFHREFHPGQLLRQGDAMVLAVRYKANDDRSKLPNEEPDHPLSVPLHVQKGYDMGLMPPSPFESWNVIRRTAWNDLARSAGVSNPEAIVVTIPPKTVASAPIQPLPATGAVDSSGLQPVQQQPVAQPSTGYKPVTQPVTYVPPQPTYVPNPPGAQPVTSGQQPTYVPNPPTSQPVTSGRQPTTFVPNPPSARPVSSDDDERGNDFDPADYPSPADPNDGYFAIGIPSLGINDLKVSHPTDVASQAGLLAPLQSGVGHLFSYPGNGGTILVYGHSSSYSWDVSEYTKIFRKINGLKPGDKVYIAYGGKTHTYQVTYSETVDAKDMSAYQKNNGEELILYTCWPPDDVKQRYLVHAKPV